MSEFTKLFSTPKLPSSPATARLPDTTDPSVLEAGRRRVREEQARKGRESTDLAATTPSYSNGELGQ